MKEFKFSIKNKLILLMMFISAVSLFISTAGYLATTYLGYKQNLKEEVKGLTEIIGHLSIPAIDFNDSQNAQELLDSLKNQPEVVSAMILFPNQTQLATYKKDGFYDLPVFSDETIQFKNNFLYITHPIFQKNKLMGYICLQAELNRYYYNLFKLFLVAVDVLLFALLVSYFASAVLHKKITIPITKLTEGTQAVAGGDLSVKLDIQTNDELEQLAETFNHMTEAVRKSSDALISAKEYADKIIFYMLDALIVFDENLNIKTISPATAMLLGFSFQEIIGNRADMIYDQQGIRFLNQLKEKENLRDIELKLKTKTNDLIPVNLSGSVMRKQDGTIEGIVCLARDMRELKQLIEREKEFAVAEATIRESEKKNMELEAAYKELQKVQAQLIQAQKMEAIGRLAGGIAHDFNNQLTIITGYTELLSEALKNDSSNKKAVEEIKRASERSAYLTQQLLAFSRRQMIVPKVVDINDLILNMDKMIRRLISENIELVVLPAQNLKMVKVDPVQLEHAIINMVVNARDAMPDGGKLTVSTSLIKINDHKPDDVDLEEGDYVCIQISDSGSGIGKTVKEHLFEPFFTTKAKGKGTGLGLATSYGIVKQNKGDIRVVSQEGKGTSFFLYFPAVEEEAETVKREDKKTEMPKGKETILVVEDESAVRDLAVGMLMHLGYKVLESTNGEEALALLEKDGNRIPDLVLTDVVMPRMGGRQLANEVEKKLPDVKIIFMSGYSGQELDPELMTSKMAFIQKPFKPADLAQKIREVLDA